jgi:hypothetical protein
MPTLNFSDITSNIRTGAMLINHKQVYDPYPYKHKCNMPSQLIITANTKLNIHLIYFGFVVGVVPHDTKAALSKLA